MAVCIKVAIAKVKKKGGEFTYFHKDKNMKEISKIISLMEKVYTNGPTVGVIKDNLKREHFMDKELISGQMEDLIVDNIRMIRNMATEFMCGKINKSVR